MQIQSVMEFSYQFPNLLVPEFCCQQGLSERECHVRFLHRLPKVNWRETHLAVHSTFNGQDFPQLNLLKYICLKRKRKRKMQIQKPQNCGKKEKGVRVAKREKDITLENKLRLF